jgi:RNA polymerase primary sigma factor
MRQLKISQSITNRESQSLEKYLYEIGKIPQIDAAQEIVLAQKIKAGDDAAVQKLANANLRFVVSVAKQYQNQGMTLNDLINEGNLGLIKAAGRFDETKGFKFISYAVWWIRQAILAALADQSRIVRLPLNQVGSLSKIRHNSSKLEQQLNREPTDVEIAEAMDISVDKIRNTLSVAGRAQSMDAPFVQGEENTLHDVMVDEGAPTDQVLMDESLISEIKKHLSNLAERESLVIILFFGLNGNNPHTLDEIGEKLSLTRERVRQIKDKALGKLKNMTKFSNLQEYR